MDDPEWGGASVLTSYPNTGVLRGHVLTLKACVLDTDHDLATQAPIFSSTRGQIDGLTHVTGTSSDQHCYIASFTLPTETSLESFKIELRDHNGDFMTRRTIQISDQAPEAEILIVDSTDSEVVNVLGGGDEFIKVIVSDNDDSIDGVYGDLTIKWPGQASYSLPVEFNNGIALVPLSTTESIENGDLIVTANITGANGASNSAQYLTPIVLSPPEILSIDLCQDGEEIQQLMFGQTADAVVRIRSSRQVTDATASLEQFGWIVAAPSQSATECGNDLAEQDSVFHFRIQLDSSFVPGEGSLGIRVVDIDEITSISYLNFEFLHSPPQIQVSHPANVSHASLLDILLEMEDADGIDAECGIDYLQDDEEIYSKEESPVTDLDGTGFWSSSWLLPNELNGNITVNINCEDWSGNKVNYSAIVFIDSSEECTDCEKVKQETEDSSESFALPIAVGIVILLLLTIVITTRVRAREEEGTVETWQNEEIAPQRDERIPEGWTLEEFLAWLDGPMPEEWEEEQWGMYRDSMEDLR